MVHHLGACLIQLTLKRLNRLQITHRIEMIRHVIVADHHKRMTERVRHLCRLDQELIATLSKHRHRLRANVVKLPDVHIRMTIVMNLLPSRFVSET